MNSTLAPQFSKMSVTIGILETRNMNFEEDIGTSEGGKAKF